MTDRDDGTFERPQEPASRKINNNFRLEIVTDVQRLLSLKPHWDDLCHRSIDYNFSQSFQWCLASWTIMILPQQRRLYCLVGWLDNRMVLMWPFVKVRHGLWSMLRPLASDTTVYSGVLVENNFELIGPTLYIGKPAYKAHGAEPIKLQAHGDKSKPLSFRNIWVREI